MRPATKRAGAGEPSPHSIANSLSAVYVQPAFRGIHPALLEGRVAAPRRPPFSFRRLRMWTIRIRCMRNCLAAGALILAACGDSTTAPGTNPEIINTADNFQYQVSDI